MFQGNEQGIGVLPLKPLLCLQSCLWASCIRVQVILEEVRLQEETNRSGAAGLEGTSGLQTTQAAGCAHLSRDRHDDGLTFPLVKLEEPFQRKRKKKRSVTQGARTGTTPCKGSLGSAAHAQQRTARQRQWKVSNPKESQLGCARTCRALARAGENYLCACRAPS